MRVNQRCQISDENIRIANTENGIEQNIRVAAGQATQWNRKIIVTIQPLSIKKYNKYRFH